MKTTAELQARLGFLKLSEASRVACMLQLSARETIELIEEILRLRDKVASLCGEEDFKVAKKLNPSLEELYDIFNK